MKFVATVFLILCLFFGVAWAAGVFDVKADVSVNKQFKEETVDATSEVLESTKDATNKTFDNLQRKLKKIK